jgi:hypothetical protein
MPKRTDLARGTINGNHQFCRANRAEPRPAASDHNYLASSPHRLRTRPAGRRGCCSDENPGEQCCQSGRHPSTTEALSRTGQEPRGCLSGVLSFRGQGALPHL